MAYDPSKVYRSGGEWDREDANFDTSYDLDAYGTYYDQGKRYRDQSWWRDKHSRNNQHKKKYRSGTYEIDDENEDAFERWLKENQHKTGKQVKQERNTGGSFDFNDPDPGANYSAADGSLVQDPMTEGGNSTSNVSGGSHSSVTVPQPKVGTGVGRGASNHLRGVSSGELAGIGKRKNRWMNIAGQAGSLTRAREEAKFRLKQMYGEQKRRRGTGWGG